MGTRQVHSSVALSLANHARAGMNVPGNDVTVDEAG